MANNRIKTKTLSERQIRARAELCRRELARRHLADYADYVWPGYIRTDVHNYLCSKLELAERRELTHIIFEFPPQHGKSLHVSQLFPSWYLGRHPDHRVIMVSYGDRLAGLNSQTIRDIVYGQEYQNVFSSKNNTAVRWRRDNPDILCPIKLRQDSKAKQEWNIEYPYRGGVYSAGYGGSIVGRGADVLIIDDPIKNREEAESEIFREKLIRTWKTTLRTRLQKNAIVIVMHQRWHTVDLAGWLLSEGEDDWVEVKVPALATENDPLGRKMGEALWPDRYSREYLLRTEKELGAYEWSAVYQQEPRPPEGHKFQRGDFQIIPAAPTGLRWVRYWDLATTEGKAGDHTASIKSSFDFNGDVYFDGHIRGKWEWPDVRAKIRATAKSEKEVLCGVESVGTQKGMVQEMWRDPELISIGIIGVPIHRDKLVRALALQTRCRAGKVYLVKGAWNDEFIEEHIDFPMGKYDDQVDASSGCMMMLGITGTGATALSDYITDKDKIKGIQGEQEEREPDYLEGLVEEPDGDRVGDMFESMTF